MHLTLFASACALLTPAGTAARALTPAAAPAIEIVDAFLPQGPGGKPKMPPKLDKTLLNAFFGSEPAAPKSDNQVTDDKVALGRTLYHTALAADGTSSCASCHDLAKWGQSGNKTDGARNAPSTLNAFRQFAQYWDGRADTVEAAMAHGLADDAALVAKVKGDADLAAKFGGDVTAAAVRDAIGAFARTLVTKSPFDEFLDGKNSALTTDQKIGLKTFIDVGCTACHTTRLLGGQMYQKLGVTGPYPSDDLGRFALTKNEADKNMWKVTSLLNVTKTAPYFHDGGVSDLGEAVQLMAKIQLNRTLEAEQVESIVAFLDALTGPLPEGAVVK